MTRELAEQLGYRAVERRPRGSLNVFYEIIAPDGSVWGSASGHPDDAEALIDQAWADALRRLPAGEAALRRSERDSRRAENG